jgi:metal transporter CNNM
VINVEEKKMAAASAALLLLAVPQPPWLIDGRAPSAATLSGIEEVGVRAIRSLYGGTVEQALPFNCSATCLDPFYSTKPAFVACVRSCQRPQAGIGPVPTILITVLLVCLSGMFSGLTLGLLSLSIEGLDIIISAGDADERRWAKKIYPMRKRGNLLLCTLLLGNTLVNASIAIISASLTNGLAGSIISTTVIVIFGEIMPQSVCARHGLRIGAASTCVVKPLMVLGLPITWPIAKALDLALGREMMKTTYTRQQLDKLLEMQATDQAITKDDQMLLSSALHFSSKVVEEIMTPIEDNFMISVNENLDFDLLKSVYVSGYTRIPVYHNRRDCIVGIVYTKDLILVDPNDESPVASILPFCSRALNAVSRGTSLEKLLADMQASRSHLYYVMATSGAGPRKKLPRVDNVIGIVTMEDLLEELISIEIVDEDDIITDNASKKKARSLDAGRQRRIEFFEMLQRRELQMTDRTLSDNSLGGKRPTADEVRALASYLSNNVSVFRPPHTSFPLLRRLLLRCTINDVSEEEVAAGRYVYVRGVPASFCCLLLHGRLQIRAGNEGFTSELGPWTTLATQALTDPTYSPDFTARVECAARILIISRAEVNSVLGLGQTSPPPPAGRLPMDAGPLDLRGDCEGQADDQLSSTFTSLCNANEPVLMREAPAQAGSAPTRARRSYSAQQGTQPLGASASEGPRLALGEIPDSDHGTDAG